ncbi:MAG: hypothetical protein QNJ71_11130 [Acidimicrobiia bacterium]|nr:hypothetical protein [Acidimicrobiia bacterium]
MADTLAYQILSAVYDRVVQISRANGYNSTPFVFLGARDINPDEIADEPFINVFELSDNLSDENILLGDYVINMTVQVEAVVKKGPQSSAKRLSELSQDIIRAVFQPDTTLEGLALGVLRGTKTFIYPQSGGDTVAVQQLVSIQYMETYGNP